MRLNQTVFDDLTKKSEAFLDSANAWNKALREFETAVSEIERRIACDKVTDQERLAELDRFLEKELPRNTRNAYLQETEEIAAHDYIMTSEERKKAWEAENAAKEAAGTVVAARDAYTAAYNAATAELAAARKETLAGDDMLQQFTMLTRIDRVRQQFNKIR